MLFLMAAPVWAGTLKDDFDDNNDDGWDHWGNGTWELVDGQYVGKVVSDYLEGEGFEVSRAPDGEGGIARLGERYFDLVVTDLMMGKVGGIEVLKEAKRIDPGICVIILTGYGDMTSAINALRLGADDYMLKPCDMDELVFRIGKCVQKKELTKKIKLYEEILPVCTLCSKIRDDTGTEHGMGKWMSVDEYLTHKTNLKMSHGYCQKCYEKVVAEYS